jgi:DNA modification methylase
LKPYYEHGGVVLYCGDCREVLPQLSKASVDVIVTDPPYGVNWQSNARRLSFDKIHGDESQDAAVAGLALALPALKTYRHIYIFGRFQATDLPLQSVVELIWDKAYQIGGDVNCPWGMEHEYIQFGVYVPSKENREKGKGNLSSRLRKGSVLNVPRITGVAASRHPSEKPVRLLRELIESSSCIDETVLDYFAGVGTGAGED